MATGADGMTATPPGSLPIKFLRRSANVFTLYVRGSGRPCAGQEALRQAPYLKGVTTFSLQSAHANGVGARIEKAERAVGVEHRPAVAVAVPGHGAAARAYDLDAQIGDEGVGDRENAK